MLSFQTIIQRAIGPAVPSKFEADVAAAEQTAFTIDALLDRAFKKLNRREEIEKGVVAGAAFTEPDLREWVSVTVSEDGAFVLQIPTKLLPARIEEEALVNEDATAALAAQIYASRPWPIVDTNEEQTISDAGYARPSVLWVSSKVVAFRFTPVRSRR